MVRVMLSNVFSVAVLHYEQTGMNVQRRYAQSGTNFYLGLHKHHTVIPSLLIFEPRRKDQCSASQSDRFTQGRKSRYEGGRIALW